jgi:hypothetical protein
MFHFNYEHYRKVREAREKAGLFIACLNKPILEHELIGKKYVDIKQCKTYTVKSVSEHWYNGWYEVFLLEDKNESSRLVFWRNIDCKDEIIVKKINENKEIFIKELDIS